jgi:ABC-type sugar transport system, periplasmic component
MTWRRRGIALCAAALLVLTGCSGGGDGGNAGGGQASGSGEQVTIDFWHIGTQEPFRSVRVQQAEAFMKANPNVKINVQAIENDAFKPKMTTVAQSGELPDIFHTWGGGVLKQQIDAGLVKDITNDISSWVDTLSPTSLVPYQFDGKTYAVPFSAGMVGFWYNKKLFKEAGIEEPPATWSAFLDAVKKLKAKNITPIALAGGDPWTGHYYWAYLAMRVGGLDALKKAGEDKNFNTPDFIRAGQLLKELVDLEPFQPGFLGAKYNTPDGQAATMGNGKAAMELMGQWAPNVQKEVSGKGIGDDLGFFPFPAVEDGKGNIGDAFGGADGYAVSADAPPAAVEFLKFISSVEEQKRLAAEGAIQPVVKGAEEALTDPNLKQLGETVANATGFQLYLDQAYPPAVGGQVNDSVAQLIAGKKTPEQVVEEITETAKTEAE